MLEELSVPSQQPSEDDGGSGMGPAPETAVPVAADEKAASEQAANEEWIRARNKRVREPRRPAGAGGPPPFTNNSGQL